MVATCERLVEVKNPGRVFDAFLRVKTLIALNEDKVIAAFLEVLTADLNLHRLPRRLWRPAVRQRVVSSYEFYLELLAGFYLESRRAYAAVLRRVFGPAIPILEADITGELITAPGLDEAKEIVRDMQRPTSWASEVRAFKRASDARARTIFAEGLAKGQTPQQISRRMAEELGTMRNWRRAVRTEMQRVNNAGFQNLYEGNRHLFAGQQYSAAFDDRTCVVCAGDDGKVFWEPPVPPGEIGMIDRPAVPRHWNCRCSYLPIMKDAADLGFPPEVLPPGYQKTIQGQLSRKVSYDEWLRTQEKSFQLKALGPKRFGLFQQGVSIRRFSVNGRALAPAELDALAIEMGLETVPGAAPPVQVFPPKTPEGKAIKTRFGGRGPVRLDRHLTSPRTEIRKGLKPAERPAVKPDVKPAKVAKVSKPKVKKPPGTKSEVKPEPLPRATVERKPLRPATTARSKVETIKLKPNASTFEVGRKIELEPTKVPTGTPKGLTRQDRKLLNVWVNPARFNDVLSERTRFESFFQVMREYSEGKISTAELRTLDELFLKRFGLKVGEVVDALPGAFAKLPKYEGAVYRGLKGREMLRRFQVGQEFELKRPQSFTRDAAVGANFAGVQGSTPGVILRVRRVKGVAVERYLLTQARATGKQFIAEKEVVLLPGQKFRVVRISKLVQPADRFTRATTFEVVDLEVIE